MLYEVITVAAIFAVAVRQLSALEVPVSHNAAPSGMVRPIAKASLSHFAINANGGWFHVLTPAPAGWAGSLLAPELLAQLRDVPQVVPAERQEPFDHPQCRVGKLALDLREPFKPRNNFV